jgi:predicted DNA-binding transcriptional regulator AlpA
MGTKPCTTQAAADSVGITRATLQDWIKKKKFVAPKLHRLGGIAVRLWSPSDINRLRTAKKNIYQEKRPKK